MRSETKAFSQSLRKNMTKEEKHLWYDFLKSYPFQFRRQVPFGPYILDFYCAKCKLAIELDGSQHFSEEGIEYDRKRTEFLMDSYGIKLMRFTNLEVTDHFEGVCTAIEEAVLRNSPSSAPSGGTFPPVGGRPV